MAEHELNKIVDDEGEVFNLRDSTKQPVADRVTSVRATSSASNDKYPSEKAVASALEGKAAASMTSGVVIANGDKLVITDASDSNKLKVIQNAQAFDGSSTDRFLNKAGTFTLPKEADVDWGGEFRQYKAALETFTQQNAWFGPKTSGIVIEYSNNRSSNNPTWTDYRLDEISILKLFSGIESYSVYCGKNLHVHPGYTGTMPEGAVKDLTDDNIADQGLRITVSCRNYATRTDSDNWMYASVKRLLVNYSRNSSDASYTHCVVETLTGVNFKNRTDEWVTKGDYRVAGDSSWNSIPFNEMVGGSYATQDTRAWVVRFTLWADKLSSSPISSQTGNGRVVGLIAISNNVYAVNNDVSPSMQRYGLPYTVDYKGGATFKAVKFTARKLKTNLARTADSTFDGSADQTNIPVAGTLPIANGGTGKSSVTSGNYVVGAGTSALIEKTPKDVANNVLPALDSGNDDVYGTDLIVASNHSSGQTDYTKFVRRTAEKLWNYIKDQISSVLGLSENGYTGNAATATTATTAAGYTNDGAIATALSGKVDKETGKGLSTNDFTDAYKSSVDSNTSARHTHSNKTVLDGISSTDVSNWNAAEPNVQSDWKQATTTADDYIKNKPMCGNIVVPNAKWLKLSIPMGTQALHASFMMQTSHGATQMLGVLCMSNYISGDTETITGVSICMLRGGKNAGQNIDGVYEKDDGNGYKNFYLYFGDDNAQHNVYWTWAGGTNNISISVADSTPSTALSMGHSYLPVIAKNIADSSISVGSDTQGVYVSDNGRIEACKKLVQAVNSIDTSNMAPDVLYVM